MIAFTIPRNSLVCRVYLVGFLAKYCDFNSNVQQKDIKKENIQLSCRKCHDACRPLLPQYVKLQCWVIVRLQHHRQLVLVDHPGNGRFDTCPNIPGLACKVSEFKYHQFVVFTYHSLYPNQVIKIDQDRSNQPKKEI